MFPLPAPAHHGDGGERHVDVDGDGRVPLPDGRRPPVVPAVVDGVGDGPSEVLGAQRGGGGRSGGEEEEEEEEGGGSWVASSMQTFMNKKIFLRAFLEKRTFLRFSEDSHLQ